MEEYVVTAFLEKQESLIFGYLIEKMFVLFPGVSPCSGGWFGLHSGVPETLPLDVFEFISTLLSCSSSSTGSSPDSSTEGKL